MRVRTRPWKAFFTATLVLLAVCGRAEEAMDAPPPPLSRSAAKAEAALNRGQARLDKGDAAGAEAAWKKGLRAGEDNGLLDALGGLCFQSGRLREAEAYYLRLAKRAPEMADAWFQLGLVRAARGHYRDAVDAQRLAVAHASQFGQAYCALALSLRETGQIAEGRQAAEKAVTLLPRYAGAWNLRGNLRQDQGDTAGAEKDYTRAIRLEPGYPGAWFNQAQLQEQRGQKKEAARSYARAIKAKPDFADAWLAVAELDLDRHALDKARADFQALKRLDGWEPEAWWGLSRVAQARHDGKERALCLVRYRAAVRRRDKRLIAEHHAGVEHAQAYEPGMPLSRSR